MRDHLTLFLHYHRGEPTRRHLAALAAHEGDAIVPLDVSGRPGAVDLGPYAHEDRWNGPDAAVYRWAMSTAYTPAKRFFIIEYDCFVNMTLREWIGDRYDADLAARSVGDPATIPRWDWWGDLPLLPARVRAHAGAMCPFGVHMVSRECLEAVAAAGPVPGVFCELRLASYAKAAGYRLTPFRPDAPGYVWIDESPPPDGPGVWHSVKRTRASKT